MAGNVTALFACPGRIGKRGFNLHHVVHNAVGILLGVTGVTHLRYDEFLVSLAHLLVAGVVEQIVVTVAKTHAATAYIHGIHLAVGEILHGAGAEEGACIVGVQPQEEVLHAVGGSGFDFLEVGKGWALRLRRCV